MTMLQQTLAAAIKRLDAAVYANRSLEPASTAATEGFLEPLNALGVIFASGGPHGLSKLVAVLLDNIADTLPPQYGSEAARLAATIREYDVYLARPHVENLCVAVAIATLPQTHLTTYRLQEQDLRLCYRGGLELHVVWALFVLSCALSPILSRDFTDAGRCLAEVVAHIVVARSMSGMQREQAIGELSVLCAGVMEI
jgi:hypothetical protein